MTSHPTLSLRPALGLRSLASVAALLAVAAVGLAVAPARASAAPNYFVGLQGWHPPAPYQMSKVTGADVQSYRIQLNWAAVEKRRPDANRRSCPRGETLSGSHCYAWGRYDTLFAGAGARRLRLLPVVLGSPSWAYRSQTTPPLGGVARRAYMDFTKAATRRYGPDGTFWAGKAVPRGTRAWYWQIWNEQNLGRYWNGRPDPGQYASFLSQASDAANRGDSDVQIIMGGMPYSTLKGTMDPRDFLQRMFRANPRIYRKFDAVGLHPYASTPSVVVEAVRRMRITMNGIGHMGRKPLYLTEMGWATGRPDGRFQVSESTQARYLKEVYGRLIGVRNRYNIKGAYWFSLIDVRNPWFWGERTGLLRSNGREKPSWTSLERVTGG